MTLVSLLEPQEHSGFVASGTEMTAIELRPRMRGRFARVNFDDRCVARHRRLVEWIIVSTSFSDGNAFLPSLMVIALTHTVSSLRVWRWCFRCTG